MSTDPASARPDLRLRIERSGGLAGLRLRREIDTAALTPAQRRALAGLGSGQLAAAAAPCGADRFHYRITWLQGQGELHSLDLDEDAMPRALAALLKADWP